MNDAREETIRQNRLCLIKDINEKEDELRKQNELLIGILKEKFGLSVGDVVGGQKSSEKLFVIKSFLLDFNDFIESPKEELSVKLYSLNKSNKIDKKKQSNYIQMFASKFKVYGKYDFEKDEIIFNENIQ